ncbi:hypothetical protein K488DRAFT_89366 [Vararia minispora EC-137]|uniref:Uncharacterized protein n=1 Tax=Vararia minispora EC-137 TaxID=1314806 RepID=A0ACB8QB16_9AGAM|nr:hypothetical protein K488DRAFT_89366 [Vararia minispora EC-137]
MPVPRKLSSGIILLFLSGFPACIPAQNLSIPTSWVNITVSLSIQELQNLVHGAAAQLVNAINNSTGSVSVFGIVDELSDTYAALALQDYYAGTSTFESIVLNNTGLIVNAQNLTASGTIIKLNSDIIHWALTFYYAYRAYKHETFLEQATALYNATARSLISPETAASGSGADRNVSFNQPLNCTNNIAGGVFWLSSIGNASNLEINAETVGPFMAMSAYLFELTQEEVFQINAQLSLDFILNNLWSGIVVTDSILTDAETCRNGGSVLSFNQAWFIEGLSVWANITGNSTLTALLRLAVPSILTFPQWIAANGTYFVLQDNAGVSDTAYRKGYTIRGLTEAFSRTRGTDIATYIAAFLNIQFNTIQSLARAPGTDFYSASWVGPSSNVLDPHGNLGAMDVLNAAVHVASAFSNETTGSGLSPQPASPNIARINIGTIVGSIIGGITSVLLVVSFLILRRRRKRKSAATASVQVDPFFGLAQGSTSLDLRATRKGQELPVHSERVTNEVDSNPSALPTAEPVGGAELGSARLITPKDSLRLSISDI